MAIQLHFQFVELLDLPVVPLRFVPHQGAVEVDGEDDKNQPHGHHDDGGHQCWLPARVAAGLLHVGGLVFQDGAHWQEFDPAQQHDFGEEQEDSQDGGEAPGQLDVGVHALVGGLADGVQVVDVAHGLHVGQDAGADEEGKEVNGHQHRRAGAEGDQQHLGVLVLHLQLHLHHGHLGKEQRACQHLLAFLFSRLSARKASWFRKNT